MPELLYLFGSPASGKTTLFQRLTRSCDYEERNTPVPHVVWSRQESVIELGRRRASFGGTDALSMSIQPKVVEWLSSFERPELVMGEGDRLANGAFFRQVFNAGYTLRLFHLATPLDVLEDRRSLRTLSGAPQNRTWLKGRDSKVRRLASEWQPTTIPGEADIEEQVGYVWKHGGAVAAALLLEARV